MHTGLGPLASGKHLYGRDADRTRHLQRFGAGEDSMPSAGLWKLTLDLDGDADLAFGQGRRNRNSGGVIGGAP